MDRGLIGNRALVRAYSQGFGQRIKEAPAAEGAKVLLAGRTEELLNSIVPSVDAGDGRRANFSAGISELCFLPERTLK